MIVKSYAAVRGELRHRPAKTWRAAAGGEWKCWSQNLVDPHRKNYIVAALQIGARGVRMIVSSLALEGRRDSGRTEINHGSTCCGGPPYRESIAGWTGSMAPFFRVPENSEIFWLQRNRNTQDTHSDRRTDSRRHVNAPTKTSTKEPARSQRLHA